MVSLLSQENGTFRITGLSDKVGSIDGFSGDIEVACQMRLDLVGEVMELLGDSEVELDMSDRETNSVVRMMAMSALDHFVVCDFEMSASLCEIVLELDPEDHFSVIAVLVYCYAMLSDTESVDQLLPFADISPAEKELVGAIAAFRCGKIQITVSDELRAELKNAESDLSQKTEHLWLEIPKFKELLNI